MEYRFKGHVVMPVNGNSNDIEFQPGKTVKEAIEEIISKTEAAISNIADYSLEEKIVGKWVDGKDIYQKTIPFTFSSSKATTVPHNVANIGSFRTYVQEGCSFTNINDDNYASLFAYHDGIYSGIRYISNTSIEIYANNDIYYNKPAYVTIRYTKVTD